MHKRSTHWYWGSGCRCWPPRCPRRGTRSRVKPCCSPPSAPLLSDCRRASRVSHTRPVLRDGSLRGTVHGRARGRPRRCAVGGRPQVREASKRQNKRTEEKRASSGSLCANAQTRRRLERGRRRRRVKCAPLRSNCGDEEEEEEEGCGAS